jgi:hypothetical protein
VAAVETLAAGSDQRHVGQSQQVCRDCGQREGEGSQPRRCVPLVEEEVIDVKSIDGQAGRGIDLIPRYPGDRPDARGGVRWVIPDRADYWTECDQAQPT